MNNWVTICDSLDNRWATEGVVIPDSKFHFVLHYCFRSEHLSGKVTFSLTLNVFSGNDEKKPSEIRRHKALISGRLVLRDPEIGTKR